MSTIPTWLAEMPLDDAVVVVWEHPHYTFWDDSVLRWYDRYVASGRAERDFVVRLAQQRQDWERVGE